MSIAALTPRNRLKTSVLNPLPVAGVPEKRVGRTHTQNLTSIHLDQTATSLAPLILRDDHSQKDSFIKSPPGQEGCLKGGVVAPILYKGVFDN